MTTRRQPLRTCVGCGRRDVQPRMLRLQLAEAEGLQAVLRVRAGRSAYLHDDLACIDGLVKSRALRRSLRCDVGRDARSRFAERIRASHGRARVVDGAQRS